MKEYKLSAVLVIIMSDNKSKYRASRAFPLNAEDRIIISGVSGKFPNSENVAEYADNLYNKVNR